MPHPLAAGDSTASARGSGHGDEARDLLLKIHQFGLDLASLPASADLHEHIARMLTTLTGAGLVSMGEYDPARHAIVIKRLDSDATVLSLASQVLGFDARAVISPLSDHDYARIVGERFAVHHSLTDVTFGAIPRAVSAVVQSLTGFDTFIGLAFVYEGVLFGTAVLGFRKGVTHPPTLLLDAFASITALSLKRHAVEADLRNTTEQLRGIGDNLPGVIFQFFATADGHMGISYMSESIERLVGEPVAPLDTLLGRLAARIVPEDQDAFLGSVQRSVATQSPWTLEARLEGTAGNLVWFRGTSQPRSEGSRLLYDGILLDITDQRRAEGAAREHQAMVDALIEASPDWVWVIGADGRHTFSNPTVERILGFTPAEITGTVLELLHPDDSQRFLGIFNEAIDARRGWTNVLGRWRCRDGRYRHLESSAVPILSPDGAVLGFRGVDRDVTERVEAENARARLEEQLQQSQKMESVGRLAGGVAHDFNNLLTVINGYSDLLMADVIPADPQYESLEQIRKAGGRAASLTQRLLAFSRKQVLRPRVLNLDRVLGDLQPMLARLVGEDVTVTLRPGAPEASVHADPHQLEQVVLNLVVNARDAMPRGGRLTIPTADLDASCGPRSAQSCDGGCVALTVSDSGIGMDDETRERMFEPFFTTKDDGKGTGLGLSMVHGIIVQSGGSIDVDTAPGTGTSIHIYLPKIAHVVDDEPSASLTRFELVGDETVLVVEDQAEVRNYVATALHAYGYTVLTAANGADALSIGERTGHSLDLVLTDVVMPHMSGRELVERLSTSSPHVRVLYMSGYTDDVVVHHGVHDERVGFLQKPFSPQQLATAVRDALDRNGRGDSTG